MRQAIDGMLRKLAGLANVNLPEDEQIHLHAHVLRHTALKSMMKKGGWNYAMRMSGNVSSRHLDRYTNPLDSDYEQVVEDA